MQEIQTSTVVIIIVFATFEEFVNYSWKLYDLSCRLDDVGLLGNPRDIEVKIIKNGEKAIALYASCGFQKGDRISFFFLGRVSIRWYSPPVKYNL